MPCQISTSNQLIISQTEKRKDIQGLRALAITSVVLFHIWPTNFTNGYLGVDVFFVISGHLMAQILDKHETLTLSVIRQFYTRRIRRIVPIFLVVMYSILHCAWFVLLVSPYDLNVLCWEAMTALTFTSNLNEILLHRDYFEQLSVYRFFLHTWSLAVEVQFYMLVPLLFHIMYHPKIKPRLCYFIALLLAASVALQWSCNTPVAFNLLFCRLWQFLAGILAHFLTYEDKKAASKLLCSTLVLFLATILLSGLPNKGIYGELLRLLVVLLTTLVLYFGSALETHFFLFEKPAVLMLADLSYVWYLVHWPVIVFATYWSSNGVFGWKDSFFVLVFSIAMAAILDKIDVHVREKLPFHTVLQFIGVLYGFCLLLVVPPSVI